MYEGAGVLFYRRKHDVGEVLLGERRKSGIWSVAGGGKSRSDTSAWETAQRETREELGVRPERSQIVHSQEYPLGFLGFAWTTFVLDVTGEAWADSPAGAEFVPGAEATDFHHEFRTAGWWPINALPPKTHIAVCLLVGRLPALR